MENSSLYYTRPDTEPLIKYIGQRLKLGREAFEPRLSLNDVERAIGYSNPNLCQWENGQSSLDVDKAVVLCGHLGYTLTDLVPPTLATLLSKRKSCLRQDIDAMLATITQEPEPSIDRLVRIEPLVIQDKYVTPYTQVDTTELRTAIGSKLKSLRVDREEKITRDAVHRETGYGHALRYWETGEKIPGLDRAVVLCLLYGATLVHLLPTLVAAQLAKRKPMLRTEIEKMIRDV